MSAAEAVDILLVEDSASDAEIAVRALRRGDVACRVTWLKDGAQALDYLFGLEAFAARDTSQRPCVILLDLKLPKLDGHEVLARLRADPRTRFLPVVIMTSSTQETDIARSYALGANSYVAKPVQFEKFSAAVAQLGRYWTVINQLPGRRAPTGAPE